MDLFLEYWPRLDTKEVFATEVACICYLGTLLFFLLPLVLFLLFGNLSLANYGEVGFHLIVFIILFLSTQLILTGFKRLVQFLYTKFEVKDVKRMDALVGLGTLALLGMVPTISQFFVRLSFFFWLHSILLYNIICISIGCRFFINILTPKDHLTDRHFKTWFWSGFLHVLLLGLMLYLGNFYFERDAQVFPMATMLFFGPISMPSATEFVIVLTGGLEELNGKTVPVRSAHLVISANKNTTATVISPKKEHDPRIECEVCLLEYSYVQYPRILKKCGHTICETCADKLLKKNNGKFILCPFCQTMTITNGPVSNLPKNHAVFDVVRELNA